jgi:RNA polymerase sigma-70 factor (ECF subfamily)
MLALEGFVAEVLPHEAALRRLARRLGGDGDDLVQETWLRALTARHSYRPGSNARGWLCRILVNVAISEQRRQARDRRLQARVLAQPQLRMVTAPEPLPLTVERGDLRAALSLLPASERRVIELADLDGLRYRDIARALDCPIGTVMSRLHRARRRLRKRVAAAPATRAKRA